MKSISFLILIMIYSCSNVAQKDQRHVNCDSLNLFVCVNLDSALKYHECVFVLKLCIDTTIFKMPPLTGLNKNIDIEIYNKHGLDWINTFEELSKIDTIAKLSIKDYSILKIPQSIRKLKNVKVLVLEFPRVNDIPSTLGDLENLKELWIYSNNIQTIPKELKKLKCLKKLFVISLNNSTIPQEVFSISELQSLGLGNRINYIPKEIIKLKKLEELILLNTPIAEREETFYFKNKSYNELQFIADSLPNCKLILRLNVTTCTSYSSETTFQTT